MTSEKVIECMKNCVDGYCSRCALDDPIDMKIGSCRALLMREALNVILVQRSMIEQLHADSKEIAKAATEAAAKSYAAGAAAVRKCGQSG